VVPVTVEPPSTLLLLHGYTQSGASFRESLRPLLDRLPGVEILAPDAPFACDPAEVASLGSGSAGEPSSRRTWWRASDDGGVYQGWEAARDQVASLLEGRRSVGILGFSQGAMLGACVAAWSVAGAVPPVAAAALVAGRVPRALDLRPLFEAPIDLPTLHVWGDRDPMASLSEELSHRFRAPARLRWSGPHVVPTRGEAAEALLAFWRAPSAPAHDDPPGGPR
jgi:pimeloyl-ACP methyl ester carboxylesterase